MTWISGAGLPSLPVTRPHPIRLPIPITPITPSSSPATVTVYPMARTANRDAYTFTPCVPTALRKDVSVSSHTAGGSAPDDAAALPAMTPAPTARGPGIPTVRSRDSRPGPVTVGAGGVVGVLSRARRCSRVTTLHPVTSRGTHSSAPNSAAPRQPNAAPTTGNVRPATSRPTCTPDCFHPIHAERWVSGTRCATIRLVTGLEKDCASPAIRAATSSTA